MRLLCPNCGERDLREFYYQSTAAALARPDLEAEDSVWDDYLHNRDNPAGRTEDLWYHEAGCNAWIVVRRNTVSHEVLDTYLVAAKLLDAGERK
jgi:heterotetrameric sarcosine oxidase delta subunit